MEPKYLIWDATDIVLDSCLGQRTLDRISPGRFHRSKFNPAQLSSRTLQKELLGIIDLQKFLEAQLRETKFTILTDNKPLETFVDRTQASQKLRRCQEFLGSFDYTIVPTAAKDTFIADAISRNYIRIGTLTEEEDFIPGSIDNTTLHRTRIVPTHPNTITCNHWSIPSLTSEVSEYQFFGRDFSHTDCEYNLCRSRGKAAGHHHTCPYKDDND